MRLSVRAVWYIVATILLVVVAIVFASFRTQASAASSATDATSGQPVQIKWLIAHQPTSVFTAAEKIFSAELSKDTNGRMTVTILTPQDVGYTGSGDVPPPEVHQLLNSGQIQLATVPAADLAGDDPQMLAFTLPYLFQNYASAQAVMNGPIGAAMLSQIGQETNAQALAFTFSGGFLVIPTINKKITSVSDFQGLRLATSQGPVEDATLSALGATPVDTSINDLQSALESGQVDGIVTTFTRTSLWYSPNVHYVYEDNEGLFLTALLASDTFYDSLSTSDKAALMQAAHDAAEAEQSSSIALSASNKALLEKEGVTVTTPSPSMLVQLQSLTQPVYTEYSYIFDPDFVATVKNAEQSQ